MLLAIFPIILTVLGAVGYAISSHPKVAEMSRLAFACGLLALAFALAAHVVRVG